MKKWYRMPRVKFFLLAAAHILAAAGVLCILWATRYPMLIQELCSADAAKTYEESMHLPMLWPMPIITSWTRSNIRPYMIQMENMTRIRS